MDNLSGYNLGSNDDIAILDEILDRGDNGNLVDLMEQDVYKEYKAYKGYIASRTTVISNWQ